MKRWFWLVGVAAIVIVGEVILMLYWIMKAVW